MKNFKVVKNITISTYFRKKKSKIRNLTIVYVSLYHFIVGYYFDIFSNFVTCQNNNLLWLNDKKTCLCGYVFRFYVALPIGHIIFFFILLQKRVAFLKTETIRSFGFQFTSSIMKCFLVKVIIKIMLILGRFTLRDIDQ